VKKLLEKWPVLTFGFLGAVAIPLIQWLVTKEVTAGAAIGAIVTLLASAGGTTKAYAPATVLPMLAAVGIQTAERIDATDAGLPGALTQTGQAKVEEVVAKVSGKPLSMAQQITARVKAKVSAAGR
jgi:hypothetical protein